MLPAVESWRPGHWTTEKSQESTSRNSSVPVRTTWLGVARERGIISRTTSVGEGTPSSCQHVLCPGILPPRGEAWLSWERPAVLTPQWRVKCSGQLLTWVPMTTAHLGPSGRHPRAQNRCTPASPPGSRDSWEHLVVEHLAGFRTQVTAASEQHGVLSGVGRPPTMLCFLSGAFSRGTKSHRPSGWMGAQGWFVAVAGGEGATASLGSAAPLKTEGTFRSGGQTLQSRRGQTLQSRRRLSRS